MGYDVSSSIANGVLTANIVTKVALYISAASSLKNALGRVPIRLLKALKLSARLNWKGEHAVELIQKNYLLGGKQM